MEVSEPAVKLLIVEDAETSVAALEMTLAGSPGYELLFASSAREAIHILHQHAAAIRAIITDLNMPHMNGFDFMREIRADERYRHLPIIVISGETDPRAPDRAFEAGANFYFAKPYSPLRVKQKLEQLLKGEPSL
jgi:two-component system, chemotaxis family, chemotaxis protein CheY